MLRSPAAVLLLLLSPPLARADLRLEVALEPHPSLGLTAGEQELAFLSGRAVLAGDEPAPLDLALVVDASASTDLPFAAAAERPAGRWSWLGPWRRPRPDWSASVLGAEVAAANALLARLDPERTRVAVVAFAGDADPGRADARTLAPLDRDFAPARAALAAILRRGPGGRSNARAGLNRALAELLDTPSARSGARPGARRSIVILTDGRGLAPYSAGIAGRHAALVDRAALAASAGVRLDLVVVGEEAERAPTWLAEIARAGGGAVIPLARPAELAEAFASLSWVGIESLRVRNLTTGSEPAALVRGPDGGVAMLLALRPGPNRIEVRARSSDARERTRTLEVNYAAGPQSEGPPAAVMSRRALALEAHLRALRGEAIPAPPPAAPAKDLALEPLPAAD